MNQINKYMINIILQCRLVKSFILQRRLFAVAHENASLSSTTRNVPPLQIAVP
jgi:hypothetical protein